MKFALVRKDDVRGTQCEILEHYPPYTMSDDAGVLGEIFIDLSKTTSNDWRFAERRGGIRGERFNNWLMFENYSVMVVHPHSLRTAEDIAKFLNSILGSHK